METETKWNIRKQRKVTFFALFVHSVRVNGYSSDLKNFTFFNGFTKKRVLNVKKIYISNTNI